MANKPKHLKPTNNEVRTAENLIKAGRAQVEAELAGARADAEAAAPDHEAIGAIKAFNHGIAYQKMLRQIVIYRAIKRKEHQKAGLTLDKFFQAIGETYRTQHNVMEDLKPLMESGSASLADLIGVNFNEIRLLGRAVSANVAEIKGDKIIYKGQALPLRDVQTVIDDVNQEMARVSEEAAKEKKALQRNLGDKEKKIHKLIRETEDLDAKLKTRAKARDMTLEEDQLVALMDERRTSFEGYMLTMEPDGIELLQTYGKRDDEGNPLPTAVTPLMRASYISTLDFMRRRIVAAYDTAVEMYGHDMSPDEGWRPA